MSSSEEFLTPLKELGKIDKIDTFESLFQKPYNQLENILEEYWLEMGNVFHNEKVFQLIIFVFLNMMVGEAKKHLESYESKVNANKIEKLLQNKAFIALNPLILFLFKWDFNRRTKVWEKQGSDFKYKKEYITKAVDEIENELEGTSKVVASKYTRLALEFLEDFFNTMLSNVSLQELKSNRKDQFFKALHKLSKILEKDNINEIVDEDLDVSASKQVSEKSKLLKDGLIKFLQPFDFISNAFVHALIEYKVFLENILKGLKNTNESELIELKTALFIGDFEVFIKILKSLFTSIPYILVKNTNEAYFHIYTWLIVRLSGCEVIPEDWTNVGRIDLTIKTDEIIYLLEFKIDKTGEALKQIEDRNYYEKYLTANRRIIYAGITFDKKSGNIKEYEYKELQ